MFNAIMVGLLTGIVLIHTLAIGDLRDRVTALENKEVTNKGSVTATLEPIPEVKQEVKVTPTLYNNNTKIVFHNSKEFMCLARNIYYEAANEVPKRVDLFELPENWYEILFDAIKKVDVRNRT